jgi:hypothetical protein
MKMGNVIIKEIQLHFFLKVTVSISW